MRDENTFNEEQIEICFNKARIFFIDCYLKSLERKKRHHQRGGGIHDDAIATKDALHSVFGSTSTRIGQNVKRTMLNGIGDGIHSAIGATVGLFPGGGTAFEIATSVDEAASIAVLQAINTLPTFFRSYFEFLLVIQDMSKKIKGMKSKEEVSQYLDSILGLFSMSEMIETMLGLKGGLESKSVQKKNPLHEKLGNIELVKSIYKFVVEEEQKQTRSPNPDLKDHFHTNRIERCLTMWPTDPGDRQTWQTISYQMQELLQLRAAGDPNAIKEEDNMFTKSLKKIILQGPIVFEGIFEQGIFGSIIFMSYILMMINNVDLYKEMCELSLWSWIILAENVIEKTNPNIKLKGSTLSPPPSDMPPKDYSGGFNCMDDFMKATEEDNDLVLQEEKKIYHHLTHANLSNEFETILLTNMRLMSVAYRIFKVLQNIKERPFDSTIALIMAMLSVMANIADMINSELSSD